MGRGVNWRCASPPGAFGRPGCGPAFGRPGWFGAIFAVRAPPACGNAFGRGSAVAPGGVVTRPAAFGGGNGVRFAVAGPGGGSGRPATGGRLPGAFGSGAAFAGRICGCARKPGTARGGCATRGIWRAIGGLTTWGLAARRLSAGAAVAAATLNATKTAARERSRPDIRPGRIRWSDSRRVLQGNKPETRYKSVITAFKSWNARKALKRNGLRRAGRASRNLSIYAKLPPKKENKSMGS